MHKNTTFTCSLHMLTAMALGLFFFTTGVAFAADSLAWDKTFPQGLPGLEWVKIELSAEEEDAGAVVEERPEAACVGFYRLDL